MCSTSFKYGASGQIKGEMIRYHLYIYYSISIYIYITVYLYIYINIGAPRKTTLLWKNNHFEDVSLIKHCDFPAGYVSLFKVDLSISSIYSWVFSRSHSKIRTSSQELKSDSNPFQIFSHVFWCLYWSQIGKAESFVQKKTYSNRWFFLVFLCMSRNLLQASNEPR